MISKNRSGKLHLAGRKRATDGENEKRDRSSMKIKKLKSERTISLKATLPSLIVRGGGGVISNFLIFFLGTSINYNYPQQGDGVFLLNELSVHRV